MAHVLYSKAVFMNGIRVSITAGDYAFTQGYKTAVVLTFFFIIVDCVSGFLVCFWSGLAGVISISTGGGKSFVLRVSIFYYISFVCDM